ncbi:tail fiber domain-containing protein [Chishuiella changwenlii]|uniref:tail fiber domain-containing protein n=1 Tax=Chishuiella changwenlii TaxID=1434701 RepID=UPI002FD99A35
MNKSTVRLFMLSNVILSGIVFSQVGINTATPQATLDILSTGSTAATKSMRISNSDNTETVTVTDQGRVGINRTVPAGQLHVATTGPNGIISERASTNATSPPYINFRRNRSVDLSTNEAVASNDILGAITFSGNTGNGYQGDPIHTNSSIQSIAAENFSTTNQGSLLKFTTVAAGTIISNVGMTITDRSRVGIGTETPNGQLHISTSSPEGIISERWSIDNAPPYLILKKNKSDNSTTNVAVAANDALGALVFSGNTGNGYSGDVRNSNSSILVSAAENFRETAKGSLMEFRTVPRGSVVNALRMTITDQGRVGVGTGAPAGQLHINTTFANGIISERSNDGPTNPPYISLRRNKSSDVTVNGAVTRNDILGAITFVGNTGSGYQGDPIQSNSSIQSIAAETFTTSAQGSSLRFHTVPLGTVITQTRMIISSEGLIGMGRAAETNRLEINGEASKTTAGAFLANSDSRLKKDIQPISGEDALSKLTKLEGVTYYWNDDKTGTERPKEKQIGFIAQNIQQVFPEKVTTDKQGYLQTAYGDYDAIFVESIKALNEKIKVIEAELNALKKENTYLRDERKK